MKFGIIFLLFGVFPGFYASLEHLSYRVRRNEPDDLESSGDGDESLSPGGETHVDEERDNPIENGTGGGGHPVIPQTEPAAETTDSDVTFEPDEVTEAPKTETPPNPEEVPEVEKETVEAAKEEEEPPPPKIDTPLTDVDVKEEPEKISAENEQISTPAPPAEEVTTVPPILEAEQEKPTEFDKIQTETEKEPEKIEEPSEATLPETITIPSDPPKANPVVPEEEVSEKVIPDLSATISPIFERSKLESKKQSSELQSVEENPSATEEVHSSHAPPQQLPTTEPESELINIENKSRSDKNGGIVGSKDENKVTSGGKWSLIPVDDLSLLIFILLCLMLILIILVCCFFLQHMTSWAIIKLDFKPTPGSNTYENVCPIQEDQESVAKYSKDSVELMGFSTFRPSSSSSQEKKQSSDTKLSMKEQKKDDKRVHRSTAEVILTGMSDNNSSQFPTIVATVNRNNNGYLQALNVDEIQQRPLSAQSRDVWYNEILKKIENEDAEPEPSFEEIRTRLNPTIITVDTSNNAQSENRNTMTFIQKFGVKSQGATANQNLAHLHVQQNEWGGSEGSKSGDELSGDELEDYLEKSSFQV